MLGNYGESSKTGARNVSETTNSSKQRYNRRIKNTGHYENMRKGGKKEGFIIAENMRIKNTGHNEKEANRRQKEGFNIAEKRLIKNTGHNERRRKGGKRKDLL